MKQSLPQIDHKIKSVIKKQITTIESLSSLYYNNDNTNYHSIVTTNSNNYVFVDANNKECETIFETGFEALPDFRSDDYFDPFPLGSSNVPSEISGFYLNTLQDSWRAFIKSSNMYSSSSSSDVISATSNPLASLDSMNAFAQNHRYYKARTDSMWNEIKHYLLPVQYKYLNQAGIYPRITPTTILPKLSSTHYSNLLSDTDEMLFNLIGAYAVLFALEQQQARCLSLSKSGELNEIALKLESSNRAHKNWSPKDRPEWLLLEIEMNILVRPLQVTVAERMTYPPDNENALLQFNMGEGKTSVVIPLLALALSNKKHICRITFLRSLFRTNMDSLVQKLGGVLNRRIYVFPCKRNMNFSVEHLSLLSTVYEECLDKRSVVLNVPEHRLSFKLKAYEKASSSFEEATRLFALEEWINRNTRDVLDESDEILHVKYQLVYTVGEQMSTGGGKWRWIVAENVFKIVLQLIDSLFSQFGDRNIELDTSFKRNENVKTFPRLRLLDSDCYSTLCRAISERIVDRSCAELPIPELVQSEKESIIQFITRPEVGMSSLSKVLQSVNADAQSDFIYPSFCDVLLVLRGMMAYNVLKLVLSKRWRVNYGVNENGNRKMAIPFRAKDVPAEGTDFGHPDVAILYTLLSYYYSGLNHSQLEMCFEYLSKLKNPEDYYQNWISGLPNVHESINHHSRVNLSNYIQKTELLFPVLEKNMEVIHFYLNHVVFPRECKVFSGKMSCSAWDLCPCSKDKKKYPLVTGFSGTNDSALLLPLSISQKDLPELKGTNGLVLHNLLRTENNNYLSLPNGITAMELLSRMVNKPKEDPIHLLLDVGALMIELTNEQVAKQWLKLLSNYNHSNIEAVVYFDDMNKLVVRDKSDRVTVLEYSPYKDTMDRCVVYLDDVHTRGTDLKIPRGKKACVTLGNGVTKDKLVQACMRMRMLGNGHSLEFWASHEVDSQIKEGILNGKYTDYNNTKNQKDKTNLVKNIVINGAVMNSSIPSNLVKTKIGVRQVIEWSLENSRVFTEECMPLWASQGVNFAVKEAVNTTFDDDNTNGNGNGNHNYNSNANNSVNSLLSKQRRNVEDFKQLGEDVCEREVVELMRIYGIKSKEQLVTAQIVEKVSKTANELKHKRHHRKCDMVFQEITQQIIKHCNKYITNTKRLGHFLEEEQERELEHELEEETMVELPATLTPAIHRVDEIIQDIIEHGFGDKFEQAINEERLVTLPKALKKTSLYKFVKEEKWGSEVYVTTDFLKVSKEELEEGGEGEELEGKQTIMRPVNWIVRVKKDKQYTKETVLKDTNCISIILSQFEANELYPIFKFSAKDDAVSCLIMYSARTHPQQKNIMKSQRLYTPHIKQKNAYELTKKQERIQQQQEEIEERANAKPFANWDLLNTRLSIFAGNMYFEDKEEQKVYCDLLGIIPHPRTDAEQEAFEKKYCYQNGFVKPKHRYVTSLAIFTTCEFEENPETLLLGVLEKRYENLPIISHVSQVLVHHNKPIL